MYDPQLVLHELQLLLQASNLNEKLLTGKTQYLISLSVQTASSGAPLLLKLFSPSFVVVNVLLEQAFHDCHDPLLIDRLQYLFTSRVYRSIHSVRWKWTLRFGHFIIMFYLQC